jgi:integrase
VTLPSYRKGREPANKGKKYPPEPLTQLEVDKLIHACGRGPAGRRNAAMIVVMARAGLRIGEVLALRPKDVDLERGQITVLHGKGNKRRLVALEPGACALVERWTRERKKLGVTGLEPLFCVISKPTVGKPVHYPYVNELLKALARKAGIEKRVVPHGLRHTYASYLAEHPEISVKTVQTMLGHSSLAITDRYLHTLNPAEELEKVRSLAWRELSGRGSSGAIRPAA